MTLIATDATPEQRAATHTPGDVFQITEVPPERIGWLGAFVLATEVKSWGIQGFVHHIGSHEVPGQAFIRLKWADIEYIGRAKLLPP